MNAKDLLAIVESHVFDPTFDTIELVEKFVLDNYALTGKSCVHPFADKLVGCLGGNVVIVQNDLPESYFKSQIKMSVIEENLFRMMRRHVQLNQIEDITDVNILLGGQSGKVPLGNSLQIFTVTEKGSGQFFDLVAYTKSYLSDDETRVLSTDYSRRHVTPGLSHSGDIDSLLHFMTISEDFPEETNILVGAVGYSKTRLVTFVHQNPMICIIGENHINLVPCPLDCATLGNATFSGMFVCKVVTENGTKFLHYKVLPKVIACVDVNTGDHDDGLGEKLIGTLDEHFEVITEVKQQLPSPVEVTRETTECTRKETAEEHIAISAIQFRQKTLSEDKLFDIENSITVSFGSGIGDDDVEESSSKLNLPCLFGKIANHPSVLLGKTYSSDKIPASKYFDVISKSHIIVHMELNGWDDFVSSNTCSNVGNCLFVIHLTEPEFANLEKQTINCLTMTGPRSLVLVEYQNKFYYYRGIKFCTTDRTNVSFGTEVTLDIQGWLDKPVGDVISSKLSTDVLNLFAGTFMNFEEVCQFIDSYKIPEDADVDLFEDQLINMLIQMTVCYTSEQTTAISNKLVNIFNLMIEHKLQSLTEGLLAAVTENRLSEVKEFSDKIGAIKISFNETYSKTLEFLNKEMVSVKGCVSKNHSLERIKRKLDIKKNVSEALAMSSSEICDEIVSSCQKEGVVLFNVNGNKLIDGLREMNSNTPTDGFIDAEEIISKSYGLLKESIFTPNVRCPQLDADTYSTVSSVSKNIHRGFSAAKQSLTLPTFGSVGPHDVATMVVPLYDQFVDVVNPYEINWAEKCNDPVIAHFRIALRNTFVTATECREFSFTPDSVVIGSALCLHILSFIEHYVRDVLGGNIPSEGSSTLKIMRGSVGFLLTFMASGTNGQLSAWELFSPNTKAKLPTTMKMYDVYVRLLKIIPYCGWNQSIATKKLQNISKMCLQKRII